MNIYAVRDRLIDYFMQPFAAPGDKEVMAALANTVNNFEDTNAIAQAPHHFELWQLGKVTEDGHLVPERSLICDLSGLVRTGFRTRTHGEGHQAATTTPTNGSSHPGNGPPGRANGGAIPSPTPSEEGPPSEVRRGPQGGHPPRELFHPDQPRHYLENGQVKTDL